MIRQHLFEKRLGADRYFRWRGGEISRIEGISDGVFAITIALLIVSTASSNTFYDIWLTVRDLPAFMVSFAMIVYAWYMHYLFFRRYGLEDAWTVVLNAIFLFLIMILAFPLKFLSTFLWYLIIGEDVPAMFALPADAPAYLTGFVQRKYMMLFYGMAIIGVFGNMALLQWRAYLLRRQLELDSVEVTITRTALLHNLANVLIAALSVGILLITNNPGISGVVYFLMPLVHFPLGYLSERLIRKKAKSQNI
ncbi:TMEM175 family protein [Marinicella sp. W31]|uniref:TMEM175 family protein n=1 Tax=Marinicella sp. W31 TaxID=3023713 RepID=UPI003756F2FE